MTRISIEKRNKIIIIRKIGDNYSLKIVRNKITTIMKLKIKKENDLIKRYHQCYQLLMFRQ